MPRHPAPGTRDRILDNACRLFAEHGVHAVGLQQVIDESACGKNLLYREFASKDELVVAWLERAQDDRRAALDAIAERFPDDPAAQLVEIIRSTAEEAMCPEFRGCAMRNTSAEFRDPAHPAHRLSAEYVEEIRNRFRDLARQAGARDPEALADRLQLIVDGMLSNAATLGPDGAAPEAVAFAEDVIAAALAK